MSKAVALLAVLALLSSTVVNAARLPVQDREDDAGSDVEFPEGGDPATMTAVITDGAWVGATYLPDTDETESGSAAGGAGYVNPEYTSLIEKSENIIVQGPAPSHPGQLIPVGTSDELPDDYVTVAYHDDFKVKTPILPDVGTFDERDAAAADAALPKMLENVFLETAVRAGVRKMVKPLSDTQVPISWVTIARNKQEKKAASSLLETTSTTRKLNKAKLSSEIPANWAEPQYITLLQQKASTSKSALMGKLRGASAGNTGPAALPDVYGGMVPVFTGDGSSASAPIMPGRPVLQIPAGEVYTTPVPEALEGDEEEGFNSDYNVAPGEIQSDSSPVVAYSDGTVHPQNMEHWD